MKNSKPSPLDRRTFLKLGTLAMGSGLLLGWSHANKLLNVRTSKSDYPLTHFVFIGSDGQITIVCHRSEMGQGVRSSLTLLVAEELDVAPETISVVQADCDPKYGPQNTDGSRSVRDFFKPLRKAGAAARMMLMQEASTQWKVPMSECSTDQGAVWHIKSGRKLKYQDLASAASQRPVPNNPQLKRPTDFKWVGKEGKNHRDVREIVRGKSLYGIDVSLPNMVYAALLRSPVPGGTIKNYKREKALALPGVIDVVELAGLGPDINMNSSIAVIAKNTWAAFQGKSLLEAEWNYNGLKLDDSGNFRQELAVALETKGSVFRNDGNLDEGRKSAVELFSRTYHSAFLTHACLEPLVSVAAFADGKCEIWAPAQDPQRIVSAVSRLTGLTSDKIKFHITLLGGGYGRKSQPDFVIEAVLLARKLGRPVKVQWSREDDMKNGFYHAEALQRLEVGLNNEATPITWHHKSVFPSIMGVFDPDLTTPADWEMALGASDMPLQIANVRTEGVGIRTSVRVGWLRSVCSLWHAFAVNSLIDELAHRFSVDPIEYRLKLIGEPRIINPKDPYPQDTGRLIEVIKKAKDAFGWNRPLAAGSGKGFAAHYSFLSYTAMAIEARVIQGKVKVHRVVCAFDCGFAVNPDGVRAQIEGSINFGLSAALYGKISLNKGVVEQSNFHNYPLLRMKEAPEIEVHLINGNPEVPTGAGEPGVPPVAPALANALFNATGKRFRDLPLRGY